MSVMSSFLRGVYGVEPRPQRLTKWAWYRKQERERGAIRKRAEAIREREAAKREARKAA